MTLQPTARVVFGMMLFMLLAVPAAYASDIFWKLEDIQVQDGQVHISGTYYNNTDSAIVRLLGIMINFEAEVIPDPVLGDGKTNRRVNVLHDLTDFTTPIAPYGSVKASYSVDADRGDYVITKAYSLRLSVDRIVAKRGS